MRKISILINRMLVLVVLALTLLSSSCSKSQNNSNKETLKAERTTPVEISVLEPGSLDLYVTATDVLRSKYEIPITPEINGKVIRKVRDIGDKVAPGDTIVFLDPEPYELALAQAAAGYQSAQSAFEQAQRDYERAQMLIESNDISDYELETSELTKKTAEANLQAAQAAWEAAKRNVRLTKLVSPIHGTIAALNVQIGQQVIPGTPLGTIISRDSLEIKVNVSERDIVRVKRGNTAQLTTAVFPAQTFTGRVRSVGTAGLDAGRSFPVIIDVDNPGEKLMPGMIATVRIRYQQRRNVIIVPRNAFVLGTVQPLVYVVKEGRAYSRKVVLGPGEEERVIVESGLEPGDTLVIKGQNVLHDSIKVKIL